MIPRNTAILVSLLLVGAGARWLLGLDVTLDKNGHASLSGGQVTGPGLAAPIPITTDTNPVVLAGLQSNGTYWIDFFQNSGLGGSDFSFTVNADGTGIVSVGPG